MPALLPFHDTTLAILAGGDGARMGKPKGLLDVGGQPILGYLLTHLAWPGSTLLITAPGREHPPGFERFTQEATDPIPGGGPLRGVLTALEHLTSPLLLVLTVDMPEIRLAHCRYLLDALRDRPETFGAMMSRHTAGQRQVEPFPLALRASARPIIERRLAEQRKSVHGLLGLPEFVEILSPAEWAESTWTNLNSPLDLSRWNRSK